MSNKNVAFVTGGTGGIGTAICQKLSQNGFTVVAASASQTKATDWKKAQQDAGFDSDMHLQYTATRSCSRR